MDRTIAVFYNGSLAHYTVTRQTNGTLKAYLLNKQHTPTQNAPSYLLIQKEGNHWTNPNGHADIADYIGQVYENQYDNQGALSNSYKQESYV